MAKQEQVQFVPRVPIAWLHDYMGLLKAALIVKPPADSTPEIIASCTACDYQIASRMTEVQNYLDRMYAGPSSIN